MSQAQSVWGNGAKLVGEALIPGGSEMLGGRVESGLLHTVLAAGAASLLAGMPALAGLAVLAIKANSYSRSVSGQNLFDSVAERVAANPETSGRRAGRSRPSAP
jgi:hypothetical protein